MNTFSRTELTITIIDIEGWEIDYQAPSWHRDQTPKRMHPTHLRVIVRISAAGERWTDLTVGGPWVTKNGALAARHLRRPVTWDEIPTEVQHAVLAAVPADQRDLWRLP